MAGVELAAEVVAQLDEAIVPQGRGPLPRMDDESPHRTRSRLSENASFCRNSQMLFVKHVQNH